MDGQQSEKREKFEKEVAAHPFLLGMNEQHVRLLADCAMHSHFHTDEIIFREGEAANRFYLIVRGKIGSNRQLWANRFRLMRYTMAICWGGRGFSHPMPGTYRARGRNRRDFLLRHDFAGVCEKFTPSAPSSSSE